MNINTSNIIFYCDRWNDTVSFYQNILKLDITFSNDWFVEFELNKLARLSVADSKHSTIKSAKGQGCTLSLNVCDLNMVHTDMLSKGADPSPVKKLWGSKVFYVFDPEGNRIEFWEEIK